MPITVYLSISKPPSIPANAHCSGFKENHLLQVLFYSDNVLIKNIRIPKTMHLPLCLPWCFKCFLTMKMMTANNWYTKKLIHVTNQNNINIILWVLFLLWLFNDKSLVISNKRQCTHLSVGIDEIDTKKIRYVINQDNVKWILRSLFYSDNVIIKRGYKISHQQKYLKKKITPSITH